jgi:hypothetical protein
MPDGWKMGVRNPGAKIDWLTAAMIRGSARGYGRTKALAEQVGLSRAQVRRIRSGAAWVFERRAA